MPRHPLPRVFEIVLFLLAGAQTVATETPGGRSAGMRVTLVSYRDLSGESEPHVVEVNSSTRYVYKIEATEAVSLRFTALPDCRVAIKIESGNITKTEPVNWPTSFGWGDRFVIGIFYPHHVQELRGTVSGSGPCKG